MLAYFLYRKLNQLEGELGESFSITFQAMISVLVLTVLSFYYEWHTVLVFLGNWPSWCVLTTGNHGNCHCFVYDNAIV